MRKVIFLFLCSICCLYEVSAKTYYSEYYPYLSAVEEDLKESDVLKREEYKVYNTYQEVKVPTSIEIDKRKCSNYYKDIYYDEIISTSKEKQGEYDLLYGAINYQGYYAKEFRFSFKEAVNVKEIYITNKKGEIIPYKIIESTIDNSEALNDSNYDKSILVEFAKYFTIKVDNLFINDLEIHMISEEPVHVNFKFITIEDRHFMGDVRCNHFEFLPYAEYRALRDKYGKIPGSFNLDGYYKNIKRSYVCYKSTKINTNIYTEKNDNSNLDDYKILYNYFKRDKVIIDDKTIKSNHFDLRNLIKYSTVDLDNIIIKDNINYEKNGKYNVEFIINENFIINHEINLEIDNEILNVSSLEEKNNNKVVYLTENEESKSKICKNEIVEKIVYKNKNQNIVFICLLTFILLISVLLVIRKFRRK